MRMSNDEDAVSPSPTTSKRGSNRVTQRDGAELAGVSQATVSLVLNGRTGGGARIPEATRQRVTEAIEQLTYVADPAARRLAGLDNKIIGVFTYEPAFPSQSLDFYTPLLTGIEAAAERHGSDLLMFTSAPVRGGRRQLFHERNRLRLADGVLLLGVEMDTDELTRLAEMGVCAVAVGRREHPDIPYVGIDYTSAAADLVGRAVEQGHRRVVYLHLDSEGESVLDRRDGVALGCAAHGLTPIMLPSSGDAARDWARVRELDPDLLVVELSPTASAIRALAAAEGVAVPADLSVVVLSAATRADEGADDFTRLEPPRTELGARAVDLLARLLTEEDIGLQERRSLLPCPTVTGSTVRTRSAR